MNRIRAWTGVVILAVAALVLLFGADASRVEQDRLGRFRNLGKAFYENPTTQPQAVDEFKKALDLAPNSAREHVNYGLALLRAGRTKEGVAELERAQKLDPKIPHTWFNLGLAFKKAGPQNPAYLVQLGASLQEGGRVRAGRHPVRRSAQAGARRAGVALQLGRPA